MSLIKGIYAASMSVLNDNLTLNIAKTIKHAENLKLDNFSVLPGSESKLLKGLELGCSGIITAICNVSSAMARKVYDDFFNKKEQTINQKLCDVRNTFEKYNLISALHSYYSKKDLIYKNVLPPLSILSPTDKKELTNNLEKLNFI